MWSLHWLPSQETVLHIAWCPALWQIVIFCIGLDLPNNWYNIVISELQCWWLLDLFTLTKAQPSSFSISGICAKLSQPAACGSLIFTDMRVVLIFSSNFPPEIVYWVLTIKCLRFHNGKVVICITFIHFTCPRFYSWSDALKWEVFPWQVCLSNL